METFIVTVELQEEQALAFAQFLKRIALTHYMDCAIDVEEAQIMIDAGERIRKALAEAGFSPR
jgi:hypothetical protein